MKPITIAAFAAPLILSCAAGSPPQAAASQQPTPYTYVGTVQELQPEARTLSMLTGVGLALRVVEMRVPEATPIVGGREALSLIDLKPGDILRAVCHLVANQLVADRIDRLPPTGASQGRTP